MAEHQLGSQALGVAAGGELHGGDAGPRREESERRRGFEPTVAIVRVRERLFGCKSDKSGLKKTACSGKRDSEKNTKNTFTAAK